MKGAFIVFYGINNLGKSTQAKILVETLKSEGVNAEYIKYPIYDLAPSGTMLNAYLRGGNPYELSPREAQMLYALNRTQFETVLKTKLESGVTVIAEDYTGTGLAWGMGGGVDEKFLKEINSHLLKEDLAFWFDGQRFTNGIESGHKHEQDNELTTRVRQTHEQLANEFSWTKINANQQIDTIQKDLYQRVRKFISQ